MKKTNIIFIIILLLSISIIILFGQGLKNFNNKNDNAFFIENKGQWFEEVFYLTIINGLDVWITKRNINYTIFNAERKK